MDRDNHRVSGALSGNRFALARRLGNPFGTVKPVHFSNSAQGIDTGPSAKELPGAFGSAIAHAAIQSIGISTKKPYGPPARSPEYALAVSLIFTKATNQSIMLGTPPGHVLSTSILWASLVHDKRFEQVPMNEAAPGDIVIGSGWQQGADGYAGIAVAHGRIVSNGRQGVRDNSSVLETHRSHPGMTTFRYVGFWNYYRRKTLANAGFNADEPRVPAGQPGGGQWTTSMAPSTVALSGKDNRISSAAETNAPRAATPPVPRDEAAERMMQIDPPIASDPISEALELLSLASIPSLLKSIPSLVAISAKGLSALLRKLAAIAAGKAVTFTEEESGLLAKILSRLKKGPSQSPDIAPEEIAGKTRSGIRGLAKQKGLEPAGDTTSPDYPRKWKYPITGRERLRLDRGHIDSETGQPYDNPNAASDHVHAYDSNGKKIKVNNDPHIPTTGD